jgi:hypothetical protein
MIDIISLSIAIGAVIVSILTHIKNSKCCGVIEINTNDNKENDLLKAPPPSPVNITETTSLLEVNNPSPKQSPKISRSLPIDIPPRPKPKIKNYL